MASALVDDILQPPAESAGSARSALVFAATATAVIVAACLLAGFAPLGFSIVTVFLFAGPHNWLEARYLLTRMPARWGPLSLYFTLGIAGVVLLSAGIAGVRWLGEWLNWDSGFWLAMYATWNSALVGWIASLALLRSRQNPRRNWAWIVPVGFVFIAVNWLWPLAWSLALVYLHPLVALCFLDREIGRMQPGWRAAYRGCLLLVPLALGILWWNLAAAPNLPGNDWLQQQITQHAGAGILSGVSTHLLVATHTFLEMLHYGVWIVAIPLVSVRMRPWRLDNVPLARRSVAWRAAILTAVAAGVIVMLVLWGGFVANYPLTRDIYFTVAMLHVLAEVPFLLRLL
jgi:hypothetical protein